MIMPDVVQTIVRRRARFSVVELSGGRLGQHPHNAFDNIIYIRKVPMHLSLVVNLNGRSLMNGLAELEDRHVRPAPWSIDRKKTKSGDRESVEMRINVGNQLIALLCGGIQADWVINIVSF